MTCCNLVFPVLQKAVEMIIENVTMDDTGVFTCHAKNSIGEPATATTTIVVQREYYDTASWVVEQCAVSSSSYNDSLRLLTEQQLDFLNRPRSKVDHCTMIR